MAKGVRGGESVAMRTEHETRAGDVDGAEQGTTPCTMACTAWLCVTQPHAKCVGLVLYGLQLPSRRKPFCCQAEDVGKDWCVSARWDCVVQPVVEGRRAHDAGPPRRCRASILARLRALVGVSPQELGRLPKWTVRFTLRRRRR